MFTVSWLLIGVIAAVALVLWAQRRGPSYEARTLANGLLVAALIYVGFAVVWGSPGWMLLELLGVLVFAGLVWGAFHHSMVWLGVGWLLHPLWDGPLHLFGPGMHIVPAWYALACLSFDVVVGVWVLRRADLLDRSTASATNRQMPE